MLQKKKDTLILLEVNRQFKQALHQARFKCWLRRSGWYNAIPWVLIWSACI